MGRFDGVGPCNRCPLGEYMKESEIYKERDATEDEAKTHNTKGVCDPGCMNKGRIAGKNILVHGTHISKTDPTHQTATYAQYEDSRSREEEVENFKNETVNDASTNRRAQPLI